MANRTPYKPLSAKEAGGWTNYLDLPSIKAKHNGLGSADLMNRVALKVNWRQIARDFNIKDSHTIKKWAKDIQKEQA